MICESLDYYNFRNIETAHIDLCPGINVLYGENAEGKTNAIEGIYLFAGGRSFRAHSDAEMIRRKYRRNSALLFRQNGKRLSRICRSAERAAQL